MADGEMLPPTVPFTRGCKTRASLPVGRSSGQTRERSLGPGVLYLQYGEETKQVRMPVEVGSHDTLRALFVAAFPQQLTMKMLQSPNMAIYIKDTSRNVYYDLEDIRNITSHSCLKVYHKDPAHVFNRHTRPANTEGRISKEVLYGSHSPVHTLSSSSRSTLHSLQGSMSPPMVRSMPSSPSRMAYGGGSTRGAAAMVDLGSATLPRERLPGSGRASTLYTSSSAILERRDVKPDEDVGNSKSMALVVRGEGRSHYPDTYCSSIQDGGGGRLSITSAQCSAPPSLAADMVDAGGITGIPGGLQQFRASVKPLMGYGESMEHQTLSLHRQKSRKYGDSQLPPLGTKTPPSSPHRVNEVRMIDGQIIGGVGLVCPERMSPIRRSLQRDSNGAPVEMVNRSRGSGSSSSTSSVFVDCALGQPERLFQDHNTQSERMKAMEEQIASLAGLVHHALSMGSDTSGVKDPVSESGGRKLKSRPAVPSESQDPIDSSSPALLALEASDGGLQQSLVLAKRNVSELRLQLNQLRQLQLSSQESVSSMLRMAGQELVVLMCDRLAQSEEAAYRWRAEMEEERTHYVATEERILSQLSELEDYVDHLQRSSASGPSQLSITLREVEEGAVNLRRVGEALAILKGEFPELQVKMRSVLKLEVEAVRFLKEEPHKMDSMLKRVKALTEALSSLRRCVSDSAPPARSAVEPPKVLETDQDPLKTQSPQSSPKPQLRSSVRPPQPTPTTSCSGTQFEAGEVGSVSPVMARRMKTTAAGVIQPPNHHHHHPSPPLTPTHGRDSPTVAKVSPRSREGSPALQKRPGPLQPDGGSVSSESNQSAPASTRESLADKTTITHTHTHSETTERETPEGSLSPETSSMNQPSTSQTHQPTSSDASQPSSPNTTTTTSSTDVDQILKEAQASLMKSIPDLNVSHTREGHSDSSSGQINSSAAKSEQETPLDLTLQAPLEQQAALSDTQEHTAPKLRDEVDSTLLKPPDTATAATSELPAAAVEPPPSAAPSTAPSASPSASPSAERSSRPPVEKPRRPSVDKEMKQSPDRVGKSSPPPPPPRRFHAVSSGLTTGRSGEVIFTTRKEPVGAQDAGENELPVVPQPKPPRQPPEVKPKPQICPPATLAASTSAPATASAQMEEEEEEKEEEEEEDNKFMKELQVFQKCTMKEVKSRGVLELSVSELQSRENDPEIQLWADNPLFKSDISSSRVSPHSPEVTADPSNDNNLPGENKQLKGQKHAPPASQVASHNPPEFLTSDKSALQPGTTDVCSVKHMTAVGLEEGGDTGEVNVTPDQKEEVEKVVKQGPVLNCVPLEKMVVPPPSSQDVHTDDSMSHVQMNKEKPTPTPKQAEEMKLCSDQKNREQEQVCSPTTAEKKVKFTTIVTLQKEDSETTDIASPDQTKEKVIKQVLAEKKSNLRVVVTLQKENTLENCPIESSPESQQDKSMSSDQGRASSPVLKPKPFSPNLTDIHSSKQQIQEATVQLSGGQAEYAEEGGSLSPEFWDDEGPPPPPPPLTDKIALHISKTRVRTQSKEEDPAKMSGSDIHTVDGDDAGEFTYLAHENQGFEDNDDSNKKPIIVILNEPLDIQSAYKRLSTIFEYEEDLDGILSPESIMDEEETKQGEEEQSRRKICIIETNSGIGLKDITGNSQNSLHMQLHRPPVDNGSVPDNQDQGKPDLFKKTETKGKFKFKFPKNKLAAISQAIRTGMTKTGKKPLEVVVYEEEEEMASDGRPAKYTKRHTKESERFEINSAKLLDLDKGNVSSPIDIRHSKSHCRVEELCKSTFDTMDSLEESIKQLEISVDSIAAPSSPSFAASSPPLSPDSSFDSKNSAQLKVKVKQERERGLSKRPAPQISKGPNPPQSKRAKPQPPHNTVKTSTMKQTSSSSSSSSAQRSHTKSRHSSSSSSSDKTTKGQQQATQKQPSQPRLVAIPR